YYCAKEGFSSWSSWFFDIWGPGTP
nr:anti-SIV gp148 Ig heavy chain {CDR3 heavy chain region} [Macaca fascicularis=cynomolgus monkey, Peptide Partial, 24 aa] [Macaca fascicularis]